MKKPDRRNTGDSWRNLGDLFGALVDGTLWQSVLRVGLLVALVAGGLGCALGWCLYRWLH